jgi:hypothetical protein
MKLQTKRIAALASAAILLPSLVCQTTRAQDILLNEAGASVLADAFHTATGPEALVVSWSVVENPADTYTYSYVVNNPAGDVLLKNNGAPTTTTEIVDAFSVGFNTTVAGAYVPLTQNGGSSDQNNGVNGLFWSFAAFDAGSSSPELSYESALPPILGDGNAQGANPPSPWSSLPFGQLVPVPNTAIPEPAAGSLLSLAALWLLPFGSSLRKSISKGARQFDLPKSNHSANRGSL